MIKLAIIGSGTMGSGIAQIAASKGHDTVLYDIDQASLNKSANQLEKIFSRLIEKGRMTEEIKNEIKNRIKYSTQLNDLADAELIIEAIVENADIKKKLFDEVEEIVKEDCIIATNTSSLSITSLAADLTHTGRFIGMHFFNPAPLMKLVEVIPAIQTSPMTIKKTFEILENWNKITVLVKDTPGFIVNKVARPFYGEALRIFEEGITGLRPPEALATIDWAMTEIGGFKMGPFALMDYIGNDVNYIVTETVFKSFYYDSRYKPSFTQKRLSEAGYLGRKSGKGFYDYSTKEINSKPVEDKALGQKIVDRIVIMLINEAADTLHFNIATKEDIDVAMSMGVNYPKGLLAWADEIGIAQCIERMDQLYNEYHEDRYRCSPLLRSMSRTNKSFWN